MFVELLRKLIAVWKLDRTQWLIAFIRDLLFGYILLLASAILPLCGWHRAWFRFGMWWLYPIAAAVICFGYFTHQRWLMMTVIALVIVDALILWQLIYEKHRIKGETS